MSRIFLLMPLVSAVFAQAPADLFEKAPPAVDAALRARITQFYQYHVDGKFRQAEALVSEECKDFFYSANKPKYLGFDIKSIAYSDNFTRAKATVIARMVVLFPGFPANKPWDIPHPSYWKLVNGEWFWYVDLDKVNETPFGKMKAGPSGTGGAPTLPVSPEALNVLHDQVKADRSAVQLRAAKDARETVAITNHMPGAVTLQVRAGHPGIDASLDASTLKAGEKATLSLEWKPGSPMPSAPVPVEVAIEPSHQVVSIQVTVVGEGR